MGGRKWQEIRHKKAAGDAARGRLFTQFAKNITLAAKSGGGDIQTNSMLRVLVENARRQNMAKETIEKAIAKGTGDAASGRQSVELRYEGFGPHNGAILIFVDTDNKNRSFAHIRTVVTKNGGTLAEGAGSVSWMFTHRGQILMPITSDEQADEVEMTAIDAGALDILRDDEMLEILTESTDFLHIRERLSELGDIEYAALEWHPSQEVVITSEAEREQIEHFLELIEDAEDVTEIAHNYRFES